MWVSASLTRQHLFGDTHRTLKTRIHSLEKLWDFETQNQVLKNGIPAALLSPRQSTWFVTSRKEIRSSMDTGFFIKACGFRKPQ